MRRSGKLRTTVNNLAAKVGITAKSGFKSGGGKLNSHRRSYPSRTSLTAKLDRIYSKFIRLRYCDENGHCQCVSCGKRAHWRVMQAGHYIPRGIMQRRYHGSNVNVQCPNCNMNLHGNIPAYRRYLVSNYGEEYVLGLEDYSKDTIPSKSWKEEKLEYYKAEVAHLREKLKIK